MSTVWQHTYNGTEMYLQNSTVMKWLRQSANAIITTL
jgi:hypothetical protein